jgi:hypothetical protein
MCSSLYYIKLYNIDGWYYHGMMVNYHGKKLYNIIKWQLISLIDNSYLDVGV